ncbi:MAG TPA: VCBS repeat-containing protein [Candidatus Dormibacteraeota bacterium]|nr:VCBS repeat-containing protein [Candidatus Dormibacteraeota bacterium]
MRRPIRAQAFALVLPALVAATPAAGLIAFQSRREIDLGGEATAAVFAGGDGRRALVATPDGIAALRYDDGEVVRGERSGEGRGARILVANADLVAFATRDAARISLAHLSARGVPEAAEEVALPARPRAARLFALEHNAPAVAVLHDDGLSVLTHGAGGWQRRDLAAPRFAADVAAADIDADGRADLILADQTGNALTVLRGNGDGTFETGGTLASARGPQRIIAADVTGDKKPDLLVIGDEGLFLHRLTADGRLSPPQLVWKSAHVADVGVADLSGDGRPDLVVADRSAGTAVVLLGSSDGRFLNTGAYMVGAGPETILAGDVDGDGAADVLAFGRLGGGATWLHGRGDGSFDGVPCTLASFGALTALVSEDFDGDEHPDLAAISEDSGQLGIFIGIGDGRFRALPPIDVGRRPRGLAVGDFNQDDKPDLAVVVFGGDDVAVLLGDGHGRFSTPRHVAVGGGPTAISVGSFANPTSVDLAVVNSLTDSVSILYGDGHGQFPKVVNHPVPTRPSFLIVGDTNQDGNQDLVVGSAYSETVAILLGNGHALDAPTTSKLEGTAKPSVAEDFDGDGQMDLVNPDELGGAIEILPGERPGEFGRPIRLSVGRAPQALATGDFNRDGKVDIAVADRIGQNIAILLNRSSKPTPVRPHERHPA